MALLLQLQSHPHLWQAPPALRNANVKHCLTSTGECTAAAQHKSMEGTSTAGGLSRAALHSTTRGPAEEQQRQQRPHGQGSFAGRAPARPTPTPLHLVLRLPHPHRVLPSRSHKLSLYWHIPREQRAQTAPAQNCCTSFKCWLAVVLNVERKWSL